MRNKVYLYKNKGFTLFKSKVYFIKGKIRISLQNKNKSAEQE